jgi:mRNA interferase MazF
MPPTTAYSFGDVVLVPFPFTDQSTAKRRPAVVISSDRYNRERQDVIIMAITSQARSQPKTADLRIESWSAAGLLKPSTVKPVIATIQRSLILRSLGRLADADLAGLRRTIAAVLG